MATGPIHELSGEQYEVLYQIIYYGETHAATAMEILAAVETGIVEDRFHNRYEAANSAQGWRQEEPHYGAVADRLNLSKSIPNFYREAKALRGKYATSGDLAAAVQRPLAEFRGRYAQSEKLARQLIQELGANRAHVGVAFGPEPGHLTGIQAAVSTTNDPPAHAHKVAEAGRKLGATGTSFSGHANAMRRLASRTITLK